MTETELRSRLAEGGEITVPAGVFVLSSPLVIGDGTALISSPDTHYVVADGAACPLLVTADKPNYAPHRSIRIDGGVWDGNNEHQPADLFDFGFAENGNRECGQIICLTGVDGLVVENLTLRNPVSFGIQLTGVTDFAVRNVTLDYNLARFNMDGVHVNGYAKNGVISGVFGNSNDDAVALNADEGGYFYSDCTIENVTVENVVSSGFGWTAVRLLSREHPVRNVRIRGIGGAYRYNVVSLTHWSGKDGKYGVFDGIEISDLTATSALEDHVRGGMIWVQENVRHVGTLSVSGYARIEAKGQRNNAHTVDIGDGATVGELRLTAITQENEDKAVVKLGVGASAKIIGDREYEILYADVK